MVLTWLLEKIDLVIMVFLFFSGTIAVDVFHVAILFIFALFVLYPKQLRRQFFPFFCFILFFMCSKYVYSLLIYELSELNPD